VPPGEDRLALLQRQLFALITAPRGVADGLAALGLDTADLEGVIAGDARGSALERLQIYAEMYFYRILDVLRADFPKLAAAAGDAAFHNLATDYLLAHPSRHPSLRNVGSALPGYLAGHPLAAERPWLAELAALEWARLDVFDRADATPLAPDALARLDPDAFAELPLPIVGAHEIVRARHAIDEIWREPADSPAAALPAGEERAFLVWRKGVTVFHRALDIREAAALELARAGATFGALCSRLGEQMPDDEAAAAAAALLGRWVADELVSSRGSSRGSG
jgi:hypothetical protein